jgi:hypothetical protein
MARSRTAPGGARRLAGAAPRDRGGGRVAATAVALAAVFLCGMFVGLAVFGQPARPASAAPAVERSAGGIPAPAEFDRSPAGAAQAAAAYLRSVSVIALTEPQARLDAAINRLAYSGRREEVRHELSAGLESSRAPLAGSPRVLRPIPAGYRVEKYTDDQARVAVWTATLAASPKLDAQTTWRTTTLQLVWEDGWRLAGVGAAPGPSPLDKLGELSQRAAGFKEFRHVP